MTDELRTEIVDRSLSDEDVKLEVLADELLRALVILLRSPIGIFITKKTKFKTQIFLSIISNSQEVLTLIS